jgi:hypothetical protein
MKMRIKKYFLPCFLPVIAVLCSVFFSPAFAAMNKVDETELARANASITGASVKDPLVGVENDVLNPEKWQTSEVLNTDAGLSPSVKEAPVSVDLNVKGQTTLQFSFGGGHSTITGPGITSVTPLH